MTNTREQNQEEQGRQLQHEAQMPEGNKLQGQTETDLRHYGPIQTALPGEANGYDWKRETGDIQSYQHHHTGGWLHIDQQGHFYDRHAQPIPPSQALAHAGQNHSLGSNTGSQDQILSKANELSITL